MALKSIDTVTADGSPDIKTLAKELQALSLAVVAGAAANTNIAITGLKTTATILKAYFVQAPTAATGQTFQTDLTSDASIPSAGNVKFATTSTSGGQVFLLYFNHD